MPTDDAFIEVEGSLDCPHCNAHVDFYIVERNSRDHASDTAKCGKCSGLTLVLIELETIPKHKRTGYMPGKEIANAE